VHDHAERCQSEQPIGPGKAEGRSEQVFVELPAMSQVSAPDGVRQTNSSTGACGYLSCHGVNLSFIVSSRRFKFKEFEEPR
jgi:hypothetical protein